jgi:hypothetical protein
MIAYLGGTTGMVITPSSSRFCILDNLLKGAVQGKKGARRHRLQERKSEVCLVELGMAPVALA